MIITKIAIVLSGMMAGFALAERGWSEAALCVSLTFAFNAIYNYEKEVKVLRKELNDLHDR